ncbi:MAG: TRAP transporter small permease [Bacillota bacterium]
MKLEKKTLNYLLNMDMFIAGASLIVLIVVTFFGVLMRYLFNSPFVWQEEVQLWCFVWVVFFGGSAAFRSGSHVAIEVLVERMPPMLKKMVEGLIYIVVMIVLSYFTVHGSRLVEQLSRTGRMTNILDIPYPVIYAAFPIGCILMMINFTMITAIPWLSKDVDRKGGV